MRYVMKQKLFAWGDDFAIQDANGQDAFFVDGKAFAIGHQLSFQDMQGRELAFIRQRVLSWGPTYEIVRDGVVVALVKKELFTLIHCTFHVDLAKGSELTASGDFSDHEYAFTRGEKSIARVSKQWFAWTDTYGVDVADDEDAVLILASTVVIDMACHGDRHR